MLARKATPFLQPGAPPPLRVPAVLAMPACLAAFYTDSTARAPPAARRWRSMDLHTFPVSTGLPTHLRRALHVPCRRALPQELPRNLRVGRLHALEPLPPSCHGSRSKHRPGRSPMLCRSNFIVNDMKFGPACPLQGTIIFGNHRSAAPDSRESVFGSRVTNSKRPVCFNIARKTQPSMLHHIFVHISGTFDRPCRLI